MKSLKLIILSATLLCIGQFAKAQSNVRETRMNVLDGDRIAFSVEFPYDQKIVQDAWDKKMDEFKLKGKNQKGISVYENVKFPDIHFENIDIYAKVDKLDKGKSSITITVSKGYGNFLAATDNQIIENIKSFLGRFITHTEQHKLKLDIKAQEDLIVTTQKAHDKLIEEGKKLTEQLEKNKIDQENKVKELEANKKMLEELRGKLK